MKERLKPKRRVGATGSDAPLSSRGLRTRDEVLRAAIEVFGRQGYANATIMDIANEANIASGTVYQYFSDKADIFRHLLEDLEEELHRETRMPAEGGRLVVGESVVKFLDVYRAHEALFRAWWEVLEPPTEFTAAWVGFHQRSVKELVSVIRDGQRRGIIDSDVHAEVTAHIIVSMFERSAYLRIVFGWDDDLADEEIAQAMDELLHGRGIGPVI